MSVRSFKIIKQGSVPFDCFEPVDSKLMALKNLAGLGCGSTVTYIESDAKILVDTGFDFDNTLTDENVKENRKRLTHALKLQGLKPSDIDILFITHWHVDHFGNYKMFRNSTIMTSEAALSRVKIKVTGVQDGEKIADGVRVIHTPGHTRHHASVIFNTDRLRRSIHTDSGGRILGVGEVTVAAAGDAVLTPAFYATETTWSQNKDFTSIDDAITSMKKLTTEADYIIPGHGDIFKNVRKTTNPA